MPRPRPPWKSPPSRQPSRQFARLVRWLLNGGARFPHLHLSHTGQGQRGLSSRAPIVAGDSVLVIPSTFVLTAERAKESAVGRLIQQRLPHSNFPVYMTAFLLHESRRRHSFWRPQLDVLPTSYAHMPVCYGPREFALLEGCFVKRSLEQQRREFLAEYLTLCQHVPGFSAFSYEAFLWARLVVLTRVFGLFMGEQRTTAMVPFADMFNHAVPPDLSWMSVRERRGTGFAMFALRGAEAGMPLHISYGERSGSHMLLNYGFYPSDSDESLEEMEQVPEGDGWAATRRRLVGLAEGRVRYFLEPLRYEAMTDHLAFLRIASCTPEELGRLASAPEPLELARQPLSVGTEERVLQALASACQERLGEFPTTVEEDERLLEQGRLSHTERSCVAMRRAEKRRLQRCLELARTWQPLLRRPWLERVRRAEELAAEAGPMAGYLRGVMNDVAPSPAWARLQKAARLGARLAAVPSRSTSSSPYISP
jgi:protein-histidine N-methyltransferase